MKPKDEPRCETCRHELLAHTKDRGCSTCLILGYRDSACYVGVAR